MGPTSRTSSKGRRRLSRRPRLPYGLLLVVRAGRVLSRSAGSATPGFRRLIPLSARSRAPLKRRLRRSWTLRRVGSLPVTTAERAYSFTPLRRVRSA